MKKQPVIQMKKESSSEESERASSWDNTVEWLEVQVWKWDTYEF